MGQDWGGVYHWYQPRDQQGGHPMVILITDGVGEENLGMGTVFCHHDQTKMEASDALSTLCQHDSPEPSVVVVRRYTNTPYIPWETSQLLYLDVNTLSGGTSSVQFYLDHLYLWTLLPYSKTEVLLRQEDGEIGFKVYPHTWDSREKLQRGALPLWPSVIINPLICSPASSIRRHSDRGRTGLQPSPPDCKTSIRQELSWNSSWVRPPRSWLISMTIVGPSWWENTKWKWAKMAPEGNTAFQEVFAMASPVESIKLLPWCTSSAVPSHYISEALAATMQQGKNTPATTDSGVLLLKQSSLSNWHSSSPGTSLARSPLCSTPPVECPFAEFLAISTQKKQGCFSSGSLDHHCNKRIYVNSQEVKARSEHSSALGGEDMHELIPKTGTSFE